MISGAQCYASNPHFAAQLRHSPPPGRNLVVLVAALEAVEPAARGELVNLTTALVKAGQRDAAAVNAAAGALLEWLKGREALSKRTYTKPEVSEVRKMLLRLGANDGAGDYAVAEQIALGVESLSYTLGDRDGKRSALDRLYAAVKNSSTFSPAQFSAAAKSALGRF